MNRYTFASGIIKPLPLFGVYEVGSIFKKIGTENNTYKLSARGSMQYVLSIKNGNKWKEWSVLNPHCLSRLEGWHISLEEFHKYYEPL